MPSSFPAYATRWIDESPVEEYTPSQVSGETLELGDLCVWDDSNNWVERAGTDPTAIVGIAEVRSEAARVLTANGKIPIRVIHPQTIFAMASATDYVEATHRNQMYGVVRDANGNWLVDVSETTNKRVLVIDGIPASFGPGQSNIWFVKFIGDYLVLDAITS